MDPEGARRGWHTAQTSDGLTPAAFAALAKPPGAAPAPVTPPEAPAPAAAGKPDTAEPQAAASGLSGAGGGANGYLHRPSPVAVHGAAGLLHQASIATTALDGPTSSNATTLDVPTSSTDSVPPRPASPLHDGSPLRPPSPHDSVGSPAGRAALACCPFPAPGPPPVLSTVPAPRIELLAPAPAPAAAALSPPTPEARAAPPPATQPASPPPPAGTEAAGKGECRAIVVRCSPAPLAEVRAGSPPESPTCCVEPPPASEASSSRSPLRRIISTDSAMGDGGQHGPGSAPARLGSAALLALRTALLRLAGAAPWRHGGA